MAEADIFKQNTEYIKEHKNNVLKAAEFLKDNVKELFKDIDIKIFDELILNHDNSKFDKEEFEPYAQKWFGNGKKTKEYDLAWEHHWKNNPHHPEYWNGEDMEYIYILEMICDWLSFGFKKNDLNDIFNFYESNTKNDKEKNLSENTKLTIEKILNKLKSVINKKDKIKESKEKIKMKTILEALRKINEESNSKKDARHSRDLVGMWLEDKLKDDIEYNLVEKLLSEEPSYNPDWSLEDYVEERYFERNCEKARAAYIDSLLDMLFAYAETNENLDETVDESREPNRGDIENAPFVVDADGEKFGFDTEEDMENWIDRNMNSFNTIEVVKGK